jgi:mono/diheme cytochrome c family protein
MKTVSIVVFSFILSLSVVLADEVERGEHEFMSSCAVCHANDGTGIATYSGYLSVEPPDLTRLSKANDGVFPAEALHRVIDGSEPVLLHGTREMPIWGWEFNADAVRTHEHQGEVDVEQIVKDRIDALIAYIASIQAD